MTDLERELDELTQRLTAVLMHMKDEDFQSARSALLTFGNSQAFRDAVAVEKAAREVVEGVGDGRT